MRLLTALGLIVISGCGGETSQQRWNTGQATRDESIGSHPAK